MTLVNRDLNTNKSYDETLQVFDAFPLLLGVPCLSMGGSRGGGGGGGGGTGGLDPPEKSQKYRVSLQYWSRSPEKSQSYQASIQRWASICLPMKRHFNGVSLAGGWWPIYSCIWILYPPSTKKKTLKNLDPL